MYTLRQKLGFKMVCPASFFSSIIRLVTAVSLAVTPTYADLQCGGMWNVKGPGGQCHVKMFRKTFGASQKASCKNTGNIIWTKGKNWNALKECRKTKNAINNHPSYDGYPVACDNGDTNKNDVRLDITGYNEALVGYDICTCSAKKIYAIMAGTPIPPCYCQSSGTGWSGCVCPSGQTKIGPSAGSWKCVSSYCPMHPSSTPWSGCTCNRAGYEKYKFQSGGTWYYSCQTCTTVTGKCSFGPCGCMPKGLDINPGFHEKKILKSTENEVCYRCERPAQCNSLEWYDLTTECSTDANCVCDKDGDGGASPLEQLMRKRRKNAADQECYVCADVGIKGELESAVHEGNYVRLKGWACEIEHGRSIEVQVYLGTPSPGTLVPSSQYLSESPSGGVADVCSDKLVRTKCRDTHAVPHNFEIWLDSKSSGKVYVHGIPATTGIYPPKDNEISNSGLEITVPPVDWRQNGVLRGPNDQGKCGASWAFAATHTLQDRTNIQRLLGKQENASKILKFIPDLSVQHMLTCCGNVDDVSNSDTKTVAGATTTTADNTVTSATTSKISKITQATMMATTSASTTNSSASTATELLPSCLKPDDATLCGEEVAYSQCQSGDAMAAILQATCPAKCQICKNADSTTTATSTSTTTATTYTTTTTTKTQTATTTTTTTSQPQLQCHSNDNPCDGGGWVSAAIGFGTQTQFPIDVLHPYTGGSYEASLTKTCSTNSQNYTLDPSVSCAASSEWYECGRDADIVADLEEALRLGPVAVTFLVYNTFFADVGRLTKREARKGAKYVYSCSEKWRRPETLLSTDSLFTLVKDYHAFEQVGSHAVELVGHGVQDNTPYWILKNSWGSKWGDNGYFYMHKGANECDLETRITSYPRTVFEIDRNKTDPDNSRNTTNLITLKEGNDCFGGLEFGSDEASGDGSGNIGDASETPTTAPSSSTSTGTSTTAVTSTSTTVTTTTVTTTTFTTTTITDTSTTTNGSDTNTTLLTSTSTTITTTSKTTTTLTTTTSTTTATLTTATSTTMTVTSTTTTTITTTTITTTTITTTTTTTLDTFWSKAAQNKPKCLHTVHEGELVKIVNAIASKIETASGLGCIFKVYEVERLEYIVVHGLRLKMSMVVYEVPAPGTNATCNSRAKERHDTEAFMKPVAEKRDVDDEFAETIPYEPWKDVELLRDEPYYCSDGLSVYQSEVDFCRKTTTTTTTATTTTATTTTATTTSATITTTTTKGGEPIRTKLNLGAVSCDDYCKLALNDESALGSRCKAAARGAVSVPFDALPLGCGSNTTATLSNFTSNSAGEVVCIACDAVDYNISEALFVRRNRNSSVTCWCDPPDESQRTTGNPPGNTNPGGSQQPSCTEADPCKIVLDTKLWRKDNVMNAGTGWDPLKLFQTKECGETAEDCACSMDTKCRKNPYVLDGVTPDVFVRKYLRYSGLKSTEVSLFEIPPETLERLDLRLTFSVEWRTIENTAARHGGPGGFDINETDGGIPKGEPQQAGYYHSSIVASVAVTNTLSGGYQPLSQFPIKSFAFQVEGKLPFKIVSYTRNNEACETLTEQENLMKGTTGDDPAGGDADSDQNCESEQQEVKCWHSQSIIDLDDCYAGSTGWIAPINLTAVENKVGSQVTFTLKGAPPGFLINSTTGAVRVAPPRGTPTTPYTVELIGSDDAGSKALVESFVVHVLKRPDKVPDPNNEALIAGVLGSMIVTLLCIVVAYQLHAYRLKMAVHDFEDTISSMLTDGQLDEDQAGDKYVPREIKRSCVTLVKEIGNGAFGAVWKGRLKESSMPERAVAVKTVLDAAKTPEGAEDLLQEAVFMAQVGSHRNVVSMVGVVTSGEPLLLVLELCTRGSLLGVLQEWLLKDEPLPVPAKLKLCVDVAHGMAHLHSKHFIHRDLAARNCLVDRDGVAKVADFGLSRSGHTSDGSNDPEEEQYYTSQNGKFPIRWSAPESFASFRFTFASDAWSFGIVLYECFRNGAKPYKAMKNKEVIRVVQAGYRLPRPRGASNEVYQIMLQCWATIPSNRPPFSVLAAILKPLAELPAQDADGAEEGEGDGNDVNGAVDGGGPIYEQDDSYEEPIAGYEMPVSGYEVEVGTSTRRMVAETSFTTVQNPAYGDPGLLLPDEDESHALVTAVAQFNDEQPAAAPPLPRLPRQYRDRLTSEAEETEDHFTPVGTSWSDDPFAAIAARPSAVAVNVRHLLSSKNVADDLHQHRSLVTTAPQAAVRTNGIIYVTTPRLDRPLLTLSDDFDGPQSRQTSDV